MHNATRNVATSIVDAATAKRDDDDDVKSTSTTPSDLVKVRPPVMALRLPLEVVKRPVGAAAAEKVALLRVVEDARSVLDVLSIAVVGRVEISSARVRGRLATLHSSRASVESKAISLEISSVALKSLSHQ